MRDQADKLRQLVHEASQQTTGGVDVPLAVVCGGQRAVGTSTVALQLALACQRRKLKTVLVDASFRERNYYLPTRATRCDTLVDVLSGGRTVAEVLQSGPHGLSVLPAAELPPALADVSAKNWGRVVGQLRSLQSSADLIVFDGGAGVTGALAPLWQMANLVLLVARLEPVSVMDAYATLKAAAGHIELPKVGVLVNQAEQESEADAVAARIASAAVRFLGRQTDVLPAIPFSSELAGETTAPRKLFKDAPIKNAFARLAESVWRHVQQPASGQDDLRHAA